jgi:hypothetical protein
MNRKQFARDMEKAMTHFSFMGTPLTPEAMRFVARQQLLALDRRGKGHHYYQGPAVLWNRLLSPDRRIH